MTTEPGSIAEQLSRRLLAQRLLERIQQLAPELRAEAQGSELRVWRPGETQEQGLRVYLKNLEQACTDGAACARQVETFAQRIVQHGQTAETLSVEAVMPVLKDARFIRGAEQGLSKDGSVHLIATPVVDDLFMVLVLDLPTTTRFLTSADLKALQLPQTELCVRALANLRKNAGNFAVAQAGPGLFMLIAKDGYDAARFLLHDEWHALTSHLKGDIIVAPVARDLVLVTGAQEPSGLEALTKLLAKERATPHAPYPISTSAYRWTPQGWAPFALP